MNYPVIPVDMMGLPPISNGDIQLFTSNQSGSNWQAWTKPKGKTMAYMIAIGGGGGGGAGHTRTAGNNGGGGGGGACSGIARLNIPAFFLPDVLYVQVGQGGNAGINGVTAGAGASGANSFISYGHSSAVPNVLLASGINSPGGGGGGTNGGAGTAGTIPTIATTTTTHIPGQWFATVGIIGAVGGVHTGAVGVSVTAWAALPLSPGAGGAGCASTDFAGGGQTATAAVDWGFLNWPNTAGFLAPGGTGVTAVPNGSPGVVKWAPFFMTGGAGGGSNNSGVAGDGGNGGRGCGGAGGGAGTTGGTGGKGGDGIVMIVSW